MAGVVVVTVAAAVTVVPAVATKGTQGRATTHHTAAPTTTRLTAPREPRAKVMTGATSTVTKARLLGLAPFSSILDPSTPLEHSWYQANPLSANAAHIRVMLSTSCGGVQRAR